MEVVTIAGKEYPVHFGLKGLNTYAKKTNMDFGNLVSMEGVLSALDVIVSLATLGINEGLKKEHGLDTPEQITEDELWDQIDDDPQLVFTLADAISAGINPVIDKLNAVQIPK